MTSNRNYDRLRVHWLSVAMALASHASLAGAAFAQAPRPRQPMLPGTPSIALPGIDLNAQIPRELERSNPGALQWPGMVHRTPQKPATIAATSVWIENLSNAPVTLHYWDPAGKWETLSIDPNKVLAVDCPACSGAINLSMDDTKDVRKYTAALGRHVAVTWSETDKRLTITGATDVTPPRG